MSLLYGRLSFSGVERGVAVVGHYEPGFGMNYRDHHECGRR